MLNSIESMLVSQIARYRHYIRALVPSGRESLLTAITSVGFRRSPERSSCPTEEFTLVVPMQCLIRSMSVRYVIPFAKWDIMPAGLLGGTAFLQPSDRRAITVGGLLLRWVLAAQGGNLVPPKSLLWWFLSPP